jgi:hypothetical protein
VLAKIGDMYLRRTWQHWNGLVGISHWQKQHVQDTDLVAAAKSELRAHRKLIASQSYSRLASNRACIVFGKWKEWAVARQQIRQLARWASRLLSAQRVAHVWNHWKGE